MAMECVACKEMRERINLAPGMPLYCTVCNSTGWLCLSSEHVDFEDLRVVGWENRYGVSSQDEPREVSAEFPKGRTDSID